MRLRFCQVVPEERDAEECAEKESVIEAGQSSLKDIESNA